MAFTELHDCMHVCVSLSSRSVACMLPHNDAGQPHHSSALSLYTCRDADFSRCSAWSALCETIRELSCRCLWPCGRSC